MKKANKRTLPRKLANEARRLAALPDESIDLSEMPEVRDWSRAERGRFYQRDNVARKPIGHAKRAATTSDRTFFFVLNRPYCLWSTQTAFENDRFLRSLNGEFYSKLAEDLANRELDSAIVRQEVSSFTRLFWHHAVETFITAVGASLQAPDAAFAYFLRCQNEDVRNLARSLQAGEKLSYAKVVPKSFSWDGYFDSVFSFTPWKKSDSSLQFMCETIERMVTDYLSETHQLEYNSLKHGMRVSTGAAQLQIGGESEEPESAVNLSSTDSTFFLRLKPLEGISTAKTKVHLQLERMMVGWSLQRSILDLQILAMAIKNVAAFTKCVLGAEPQTVQFFRPTEDDDLQERYKAEQPALLNLTLRETFVLNEEMLESADDIRRQWAKRRDAAQD